ncbi:MAG: prepilin-type N-terminal cleavage/methylation domain-containing protein, partial [Holosporales bacterium]|nr:prepilin-type N-terminal cleavage/methylation domain-containing protein [Holosporales bacterium]
MYKVRSLFRKRLPGFSLVEISIVLLIVGILAGAIMKGRDLIESARFQSIANDIHEFQMAYANYINLYGSLPGNDGLAVTRFGSGVKNGSGNGKLTQDEAKEVMKHLYAAGLIKLENFKVPKIGGAYEIISEDGVVKIKLSAGDEGFLSHKQVVALVAKIGELTGSSPEKTEITPAELKPDGKYCIKV